MNGWAFVTAAYAVALIGTAGLVLSAFLSMRRSEAQADKLRGNER